MLDLKAKLLAAGVVTAEQVKKVEDDEVARRASDQHRRDADRPRDDRGPGGPRRDDRGPGGPRRDDRGPGGPPRRDARGPGGPPRGDRGPPRDVGERGPRRDPGSAPAAEGQPQQPQQQPQGRPPRARDTRSFKERRVDENLEKRARREHDWTEAAKWRTRLDDLKAAGKTEQYEATRGWVMKERLDNKAITEAAEKFHFVSYAGTLSHLTVEPDLKARLSDGTAGIVGFVGYNGLEHAVVPADVAVDIKAVKSEWLRHLLGVTDIDPPPVRPPVEEGVTEEGAVGGEPAVGEGSEGAVASTMQADTETVDTETVSASDDGDKATTPAVASDDV